jgi:hypothetical protein
MPKRIHPYFKKIRFRFKKTLAKRIIYERHGIKGEIADDLLSKPEYLMTLEEYCNFHLVKTILETDTPSHVYAALKQEHIKVILKAIAENKPDIPFTHLELIQARYHDKRIHPQEAADLKNYYQRHGLKFFGGEVLKARK